MTYRSEFGVWKYELEHGPAPMWPRVVVSFVACVVVFGGIAIALWRA